MFTRRVKSKSSTVSLLAVVYFRGKRRHFFHLSTFPSLHLLPTESQVLILLFAWKLEVGERRASRPLCLRWAPSGQCCAAALKTGILCSVAREHVEDASVAGVEKYYMWRGCGQHADTGKLLLHWMTHTNTHTHKRAHTHRLQRRTC